tara:strand:+ start:74941 stop:75708 length:768 start_codon:yes stop_codon:yes gene_type:complete
MGTNTDKDIVKLYNSGNYSTYELAEKFETYPNKIRRILRKNGVALRSKSAAQKNALKKGRASHPTKGKTQSDATRRKISDSQGKIWDDMSEEDRQKRSDNGKDAWNQKSEEEKNQLIRKAQDAIRESSKIGSKMERFLLQRLTEEGFRVDFHKDHWLKNQQLQVDLFIPSLRAAIEVDGPSHFKPVWGMDNLIKNQRADRQKTGLILENGLVMIRIKQEKKLSQRYQREVEHRLFGLLKRIKDKYPKENERYFEI